jgi:hypothetical protein
MVDVGEQTECQIASQTQKATRLRTELQGSIATSVERI